MNICQPFKNEDWDNGLMPEEIASNAERDTNILIRLYYLRHGLENPNILVTSPLVSVGFASLHDLNDQMTPERLHYTRSTLLALKGLHYQGQSYYLSRTIYQIIKNQLRPEEARLLQEADEAESEADKKPELDYHHCYFG